IDPTNGQRTFFGFDQGPAITLDGGQTWSGYYQIPIDQIYHIATDNRYPYWVMGSQQDTGAIMTRSRSDQGQITTIDWYPLPSSEFGTVVPDPATEPQPGVPAPTPGPPTPTPTPAIPAGPPNSISDFSISTVKRGVVWSGSTTGQIYNTMDGGKTWNNVTNFAGLPANANFVTVEAGHNDVNTAYVLANIGFGRGGGIPAGPEQHYIYRTHD